MAISLSSPPRSRASETLTHTISIYLGLYLYLYLYRYLARSPKESRHIPLDFKTAARRMGLHGGPPSPDKRTRCIGRGDATAKAAVGRGGVGRGY